MNLSNAVFSRAKAKQVMINRFLSMLMIDSMMIAVEKHIQA